MIKFKKALTYTILLIVIICSNSCDRVSNWYAKEEGRNQRIALAEQKNTIKEMLPKIDTIKYGIHYNEERKKIGLYLIPNEATIETASNTFVEWSIEGYKRKKTCWRYKEMYYNDNKELTEKDFFYGKKMYKIFDQAKLDIYADNCITLKNCDDPPTEMTTERLEVIYCYADSSWQIKYTTVNPEKPVTDFEGREKITLLSPGEMKQLLTSWGLDY